MRTNPVLPQGVELNVDGNCPTLSFTEIPDDGVIELDGLHLADGLIHLTFRRTVDAVVAAKN
jgi:hypothetical protein